VNHSKQPFLLPFERRSIVALSLIYAIRMLGLFMLLPVMVLYAEHFPDATAMLTGIAVGIYGLTQAMLQIPFGILSDIWDRRLIITLGLLLFFLGSLLAAYSNSMTGLIVGRAVQGSGAVAAAILALLADGTRENRRSFAMAIIGGSIGASFIAALVLGPLVYSWIGGRGLFVLLAGLSVVAIALLWLLMPATERTKRAPDAKSEPTRFSPAILRNGRLIILNAGIFCLHAVLTASFIAVPLLLRDRFAIPAGHHWLIYLAVMGASLVVVLPGLLVAEKRGLNNLLLLVAAVFSLLALIWLGCMQPALTPVMVALVMFFVGFNIMEAVLPAMASRSGPPEHKGAIMGLFSTCQFAGAFFGGVCGGAILGAWGVQTIFVAGSGIIAAWLLAAVFGLVTTEQSQVSHGGKRVGSSENEY